MTLSAVGASSITSNSIKEKEEQISQAQGEKENLKNTISDIRKIKSELENKKSDLNAYVAALDSELKKITDNISLLKSQISEKESEIARTEAELAAAQEVEEKQYESMKQRIRSIYESGDSYLMDILLGSGSFGEMLNRTEYVQKLYDYDSHLFQEYQQNRQYIELCKEQLELEKELYEEQKLAVEQEQQNLELLIGEKNQQISSYQSDISDSEKAIKEYEQEIAEQDELISSLEAAVVEEKKRILASSGTVLTYDGGIFKFPLASYTRISDEYGYRIHPTLGVEQFHNGVDFAAPGGTAIYAAYDGVVVAATYSATMGNYVMIDHGDSLYTIYLHASAIYVTKDDIVVRGETIAAVGSTGRSTGNHLHFSVRLNGAYVSPWNYLSQ